MIASFYFIQRATECPKAHPTTPHIMFSAMNFAKYLFSAITLAELLPAPTKYIHVHAAKPMSNIHNGIHRSLLCFADNSHCANANAIITSNLIFTPSGR